MVEKSSFGLQYESRLIACLLRDRTFLHSFLHIFQKEYFVSEIHKNVCKVIQEFKEIYFRAPDKLEIEMACNQFLAKEFPPDKASREFSLYQQEIQVYFNYSYSELEYVKDTTLKFVQEKSCQIAVLKCAKLIGTERSHEMPQIMQEALLVGSKLTDFGIDYFAESRQRSMARYSNPRESNRIPFFIPKLDEIIGGVGFRQHGSGIPELLMFGGGANKGKSRAIGHMAKNAIFLGYPGIIFSSEMAQDLYAERMDMSIGILDTGELYDPRNFDELQRRLELCSNQGAKFFIKKFPAGSTTIPETLSMVHLMEATLGVDFLWVAWDHAMEFKSTSKGDTRDRLGTTVREHKTAVDELECAGFGAFHLNRAGDRAESATLNDMAEDITPARVADTIVIINQTEEEEQMEIPEMRWVARKVRSAEKNQTVKIVDDRKRMLFVQSSDEVTDMARYDL